MIDLPAVLAAPAAALVVGLGAFCNRFWRGFLPEDRPQPGRKRHARPTPLAGVLLLPVLLAALCAARQWWLAGGVAAVAALGFVDDWCKELGRDLDWRAKAPALLLGAAAGASQVADPAGSPGLWLASCALAFVLTNATNFLDNTDGVAPALSATGLLLASGGEGPLAAVGCAALGFLPWNWPWPRLFLGDAGAYALGLCCGIASAQALPRLDAAFWPFALPYADFAQVVAARLLLGLPPWVGDRRHLTHVAQNLGLPRVLCAPVFATVAAGLGALLGRPA